MFVESSSKKSLGVLFSFLGTPMVNGPLLSFKHIMGGMSIHGFWLCQHFILQYNFLVPLFIRCPTFQLFQIISELVLLKCFLRRCYHDKSLFSSHTMLGINCGHGASMGWFHKNSQLFLFLCNLSSWLIRRHFILLIQIKHIVYDHFSSLHNHASHQPSFSTNAFPFKCIWKKTNNFKIFFFFFNIFIMPHKVPSNIAFFFK